MTRILIKRKKGEPYLCPLCLQALLHDEGYAHATRYCPKRKGANPTGKLPVTRE